MRCLPDWMDGPFTEIDAESLAASIDTWWRGSAKLARSLEGGPAEVVSKVGLLVAI
jgi:dynein heavy chain